MNIRAPRFARFLAAAGLLALAGCNNSSVTQGMPPGTTTSTVTVRLASGTPLSGLSLALPHPAEFAVTFVAAGPFLGGASCADNPTATLLRLACAAPAGTTITGPATAWTITFSHPDDRTTALIGPATCTGSLADGSTLAVTCDLL